MAGWDLLQQEYRRGAPVEPQIPKFDPTAVQLISHGTDTAVRALLGGIELAQRNKLEQEKMAQDLALTTEGHMIQRENNVLDYNNARGNMDISRKYHEVLNRLHGAQAGIAEFKLEEAKGAIGMGMDFATSVGEYRNDFQRRLQELGGTNASVLSNPIMGAIVVDALGREFPGAIGATGIPEQLAALRAQNDAQAFTLNVNGNPQQVTPTQVIGMLRNPETHDEVYKQLAQKPGYVDQKVEVEREGKGFFGSIAKFFDKNTTKRIPSNTLKNIEASVKRYHPELIKPRTPPFPPRTERTFNAAVNTRRLNPAVTPQDQSAAGIEPDIIPDATPAPLVSEKEQSRLRARNRINDERQKPNPDQAKIQATMDWYKNNYGEDLEEEPEAE